MRQPHAVMTTMRRCSHFNLCRLLMASEVGVGTLHYDNTKLKTTTTNKQLIQNSKLRSGTKCCKFQGFDGAWSKPRYYLP